MQYETLSRSARASLDASGGRFHNDGMSDGDTRPDEHPYDAPHLARNPANFAALTPLGFLARAAAVYPDKIAVIDLREPGRGASPTAQFYERCRRFADALRRRGIGRGDTVAVLAPNVPALLEAHYAVPMAGAVLNALNYRLDARSIAFILDHGGAKLLIADREFAPLAAEALRDYGAACRSSKSPTARRPAARRRSNTRSFSPKAIPAAEWSPPQRRMERDRAELHLRARPATRKASSITIAAPI